LADCVTYFSLEDCDPVEVAEPAPEQLDESTAEELNIPSTSSQNEQTVMHVSRRQRLKTGVNRHLQLRSELHCLFPVGHPLIAF
jgi:hypothetical protein